MSFFGFLGKVLTGAATGLVTGGPVGAIAGGVLGAAGSSGGGVRPSSALPVTAFRLPTPGMTFAGPGPGYQGIPTFGPPHGTGIGLITPTGTAIGVGSFTGGSALPGGVIPRGYHLNKSTYETRGGGTSRWGSGLQLHQKGTVLVKSRRMNVGNARALRRAIRRARGFEKLARRVLHLTHPHRTPRFGGFKRRSRARAR